MWLKRHGYPLNLSLIRYPMRRPVERRFLCTWMRHNYGKWKWTGKPAFIRTLNFHQTITILLCSSLNRCQILSSSLQEFKSHSFQSEYCKRISGKKSISKQSSGATSTSDSEKIRPTTMGANLVTYDTISPSCFSLPPTIQLSCCSHFLRLCRVTTARQLLSPPRQEQQPSLCLVLIT